jgi:hypothetical protein
MHRTVRGALWPWVRYFSFGGCKASLFGDARMYRPEGCPVLHQREGSPFAMAGSERDRNRAGVPQNR